VFDYCNGGRFMATIVAGEDFKPEEKEEVCID